MFNRCIQSLITFKFKIQIYLRHISINCQISYSKSSVEEDQAENETDQVVQGLQKIQGTLLQESFAVFNCKIKLLQNAILAKRDKN